MTINIILFIFIIILIICLILVVKKKINTKETKEIINKLIKNEIINDNEYNTGDLVFFVSKDSEIIWLPYYFTHVGIIVKIDGKIYILDSDPLLTGKYLMDINEYINKYCGHVYFVKMKYTKDEQQIINNNIQKIISNEINIIEKSGLSGMIKLLFNNQLTCTGFISQILYNEENNLITPDNLLINIIDKIVYIKKIKKENISNSCYHFNGLFNPFESLHPIEK
jgi:hypothetical protein